MLKSPVPLCLSLILLCSTTAPAQSQGTFAPDPTYRAPRTADQTPDISGLWRNDTLTPLERPTALGDQTYLSDEEAAAIQIRAEQARTRDNAPGSQRSSGGRPSERVNDFWYDPRETVVHTRRTSMISVPSSGRAPTRAAAEERAQWLVANRSMSHETMSPYTRCITRGMPGSMIPNAYNTGNHIFQIPGYVIILYEMVREPRIIPLDGRPSIDPKIRQWMGDTRGRWEGETPVVETTNFSEKGWITPNQNAGRMHGVPVSRELKLIERFTRLSDDLLDWQVRIEDPDTYTETWTLEIPLRHDMNYTVYEYACHEGNRAVTNILSTARHLEQ